MLNCDDNLMRIADRHPSSPSLKAVRGGSKERRVVRNRACGKLAREERVAGGPLAKNLRKVRFWPSQLCREGEIGGN
ncbi:hypothetical protein Q31b_05880 [Novipirellula aureliae]|uniref:Uncharacterized protein n=1 Tax=Novipirellula aureliae TaxID=2527966 RepID=A0A5C6ECY4_9BACT|nr:hypothetical protein Q31b_05880 [Novipirellula aureliae]